MLFRRQIHARLADIRTRQAKHWSMLNEQEHRWTTRQGHQKPAQGRSTEMECWILHRMLGYTSETKRLSRELYGVIDVVPCRENRLQ